MKEKRKARTAAVGLIAVIAVLVLALGVIAVFAQDGDPTPQDPAWPILPDGRDGFHGRSRGSANDEALAAALGITVEELQAARQQVAADRLAQAVEDGYLTRDQANTLIAMQAIKGYLDRQALLAAALDIDVDALEQAREEGTLRDLLANITPADLQANMQAAVEEVVGQAVTDTVITQEQADLVLERLQNGLSLHQNFIPNHPNHRFGPQGGFGRDFDGFHRFHGAPGRDEEGEAFAPFSTFHGATPFGA